MNLENRSAIESCEMILKHEGDTLCSETIQDGIKHFGGKHYKVSNLERRMRESDKIKSVPVKSNGIRFVKYRYIA